MYKGKKIFAINYCDENYEKQRSYNSKTAYLKGQADEVIEYSIKDIDSNFCIKNKSIFSMKRGAGLWLWKPYIILKTLNRMSENDYLFYCDAGAIYVNSLVKLVKVLETFKVDIMPFELPLISRQWTKKETFTAMEYNSSEENQILGGYILMKNTNYTRSIISEWLFHMQDLRCISPKQITSEVNYSDFIAHREDQSVFSILCRKHGIMPFRDPSQYGDRPWEYAWRESYIGVWDKFTLREKKYKNSSYPKILISNRKADPIRYQKRDAIISFLWRIGLYNKKTYQFKYKTIYK